MAKTNVVYILRTWDKAENCPTEITLCFVCAVQMATKCNPKKESIRLETTDYESSECSVCGSFMSDNVEI